MARTRADRRALTARACNRRRRRFADAFVCSANIAPNGERWTCTFCDRHVDFYDEIETADRHRSNSARGWRWDGWIA